MERQPGRSWHSSSVGNYKNCLQVWAGLVLTPWEGKPGAGTGVIRKNTPRKNVLHLQSLGYRQGNCSAYGHCAVPFQGVQRCHILNDEEDNWLLPGKAENPQVLLENMPRISAVTFRMGVKANDRKHILGISFFSKRDMSCLFPFQVGKEALRDWLGLFLTNVNPQTLFCIYSFLVRLCNEYDVKNILR